MDEKRIRTSQFFKRLTQTKDIGRFFSRYKDQLETEPFHEYLQKLCNEKNCLPANIIKKSGIERTFGHHIFNGNKNPSRDKVIQLAVGFKMNCEEAQELLKKARKCILGPKVKRDAVIIYALEQHIEIEELQSLLSEQDLPILGEGKNYE